MKIVQMTRMILLIAVCTVGVSFFGGADEINAPNALYLQAEDAFAKNQYETAYYLFLNASVDYALAGDTEMKRNAIRRAKQVSWILAEITLNRTTADETIATTFPAISRTDREEFLKPGNSIQIISDGETRYYEGIVRNIRFHNTTLSREFSRSKNESAFFDQLMPLIRSGEIEEHTFIATGTMDLPREVLPDTGTLKVWLPLPVETDSQKNITILSVEPAEFVISEPITTGEMGQVYLEIPLEKMDKDLITISAKVKFTTSPKIDQITVDSIGAYDTDSEFYKRYTRTQPSINVSPGIRKKVESIIGDETNPYRKASLIYDYILTTFPYSNVPHTYIFALDIAESDYVHETGFGDCGTQSAYFSALCRAAGIPARTCGGYQIVPGHAGPHFWAEYYLPEYGWQPVDVTVAEAGDWAYNTTEQERDQYKHFFFSNLDPYRCTIQTDVDEPFIPETGPDILSTGVHQKPSVVCENSDEDVEMIAMILWSYTFEEEK